MSAIPGVNIVKYGDANSHMDLSETSQLAKAKHDAAMRRIEVEKLARTMPVPVDNTAVCLRLRLLGQPITIFGETAPDRRERLRRHFAEMHLDGTLTAFNKQFERPKESLASKLPTGDQPSFRAEGPPDLALHRLRIAHDSLQRAQARLAAEREKKAALALDSHPVHPLTGLSDARTLPATAAAARKDYARAQLRSRAVLGGLSLVSSQVADTRAVSAVAFAPQVAAGSGASSGADGAAAAAVADRTAGVVGTASWTGAVHLWSASSSTLLASLRGHSDRVSDIAFHPRSTGSGAAPASSLGGFSALGPREAQIISAGVDAVFLWPSAAAGITRSSASSSSSAAAAGDGGAVKAEPPAEGYLGSASSAMADTDGGNDEGEDEYADDAYDENGELKRFSARSLAGRGEGVHGAYATAMGTSSGGLIAHPSRAPPTAAAAAAAEGGAVVDVKPLARLEGHTGRACRAAWLPQGGYAVTTSMDSTWRLWDVREAREVLAQPGHSMGTYGYVFTLSIFIFSSNYLFLHLFMNFPCKLIFISTRSVPTLLLQCCGAPRRLPHLRGRPQRQRPRLGPPLRPLSRRLRGARRDRYRVRFCLRRVLRRHSVRRRHRQGVGPARAACVGDNSGAFIAC